MRYTQSEVTYRHWCTHKHRMSSHKQYLGSSLVLHHKTWKPSPHLSELWLRSLIHEYWGNGNLHILFITLCIKSKCVLDEQKFSLYSQNCSPSPQTLLFDVSAKCKVFMKANCWCLSSFNIYYVMKGKLCYTRAQQKKKKVTWAIYQPFLESRSTMTKPFCLSHPSGDSVSAFLSSPLLPLLNRHWWLCCWYRPHPCQLGLYRKIRLPTGKCFDCKGKCEIGKVKYFMYSGSGADG